MKTNKRKFLTALIVLVNVILVIVIVCIFLTYRHDNKKKLQEQNLDNIYNINQSAANISAEFFQGQRKKISDIAKYQQIHNLSLNDFLQYIFDSNSREDTMIELVDSEYKGYAVQGSGSGGFIEVNYSSVNYKEMKKKIDKMSEDDNDIYYMPEFTDSVNGLKSFAVYSYFKIREESGEEKLYTLMVVTKSEYFSNLINIDSGFEGMSTILMDSSGDYILSNSEYKSDNFFKFLYVYNNLSLDEKNQIQSKVVVNKTGYLEYKNAENQKCEYVYTKIPDMEWYMVSEVPESSFKSNRLDLRFTMATIGVLVLLMMFDILWLTVLNKRLKSSVKIAAKANAAKTDFLSRMSHDIRTPINVITGMTELALDEKNPEQIASYLKNIQSSGRFLLGLVNDILDLNKVESGKIELHKKSYAIKEFRNYINAVILPMCEEKNIQFEFLTNTNDVKLLLDKLRINQIVLNLLSNAVKFTPNNGIIRLNSNITEMDNNMVHVVLKISDTGIGMSEEFQKHMFDAFSQENRDESHGRNGTGLGLAIVKKMVELMDGTLEVDSHEGIGSTFTITFDAQYGDASGDEEEFEYDEKILAGKRVLLCEDHPLNTQIVVKLLENKKMLVETAENGLIGLEKVKKSSENYYDIILMDIRMPVMNGLEATSAIRHIEGRKDIITIPIIALTANAYDTDIENCKKAGMTIHLAKPINSKMMYKTMAYVIKK